jgi:hypothetical protein
MIPGCGALVGVLVCGPGVNVMIPGRVVVTGAGVRVVNGTSGPGVHPKLSGGETLQFAHGGGGSAGAGAGAAAGAAVSTTAPTTAAPLANGAHTRSRDDRNTRSDQTALGVSSGSCS